MNNLNFTSGVVVVIATEILCIIWFFPSPDAYDCYLLNFAMDF